jgi:hypothetical protein
LVFKPSYSLPVPSGTLPDLVVDSNMDLNIRDCANSTATLGVIVNGAYQTTTLVSPQVSTVSQTGGPPICVVRFNKITVMNGFTLNVLGAGPNDHVLSLQATSDISIAGTLSFKDLPGGPAAGAKSYISVDFGINNGPGGGGGGMARAGGTGGACATCNVTVHAGSPGGAAISNIKTVLQRGSQGGGVYANIGGTDYYVNGGGSAGGALHLLSLTRVTVTSTGKLNLNGGAVVGSTSERDLGGGGGSGGALVIEAPTVSFSASGLAVDNGAGGKGGCTPFTTGSPSTCTPANGESGQLSSMRAAGGNCNGGAGNGGWEANGETFPSVNGADADGSTYSSGGGGGGSRGFIFLRGKTVANVMITNGAIISPSPTIEPVTTN